MLSYQQAIYEIYATKLSISKKKIKKVDPNTGKPSDAEDTITYSAFKRRKKVDPETHLPSTAANAVPYSTFVGNKKVDPTSGKPSD